MANEILYPASATGSYKAVVSKGATVWNGSAMVATTAAAKASGAITLNRQSTTLDYAGTFPAGITTPGRYSITVINAASPDGSEPAVGAGDMDWNGTSENVTADNALLTTANTAIGTANTAVAAVKAKTDNLPSDTNTALTTINTGVNNIAGFVDTEIAAIKSKTDNLPATPANEATINAIKLIQDKLGSLISGTGPYQFSGAALAAAPASSGGGAITLDLTQAIPNNPSAGTVGEALAAARAQGFGKWVQSGTSLTLYAPDGTTVMRTFTLNSATAPTSRI